MPDKQKVEEGGSADPMPETSEAKQEAVEKTVTEKPGVPELDGPLPTYRVSGWADCCFRIAHSKQCTFPRQSDNGDGNLGACIPTQLESPCPPSHCPLMASDVLVQMILP